MLSALRQDSPLLSPPLGDVNDGEIATAAALSDWEAAAVHGRPQLLPRASARRGVPVLHNPRGGAVALPRRCADVALASLLVLDEAPTHNKHPQSITSTTISTRNLCPPAI